MHAEADISANQSEGRLHVLISCPFCAAGIDLPHETQEACIAALHSEISRIRQVVERLNAPAFAEASARQAPAFADASARQAPAVAEASAPLRPNDISGNNPNPQPSRDNHG